MVPWRSDTTAQCQPPPRGATTAVKVARLRFPLAGVATTTRGVCEPSVQATSKRSTRPGGATRSTVNILTQNVRGFADRQKGIAAWLSSF